MKIKGRKTLFQFYKDDSQKARLFTYNLYNLSEVFESPL